MKEVIKTLFSKKFWEGFFEYYSSDQIAERLDKFAKKLENK